jgi:phosphoketolase
MLNIETAIQKIQQFTPEQRNRVIEFVDFIEFQSSHQRQSTAIKTNFQQDQDFFELAGIWENKDITPKSLRIEAWSREKP